MITRNSSTWALALALVASVVAGCGKDPPATEPKPSGAEFGSRCAKTEDCASGLCARLADDEGVCTRACEADGDCPQSPNWGCVKPDNLDESVCACALLGSEDCADGIDNDCNGGIDDCQTCDGDLVPIDDPEHCGSCDSACRSDQLCSLGECICPPGQPECSGKCTDTNVDTASCGGCGTACNPGEVCTDGVCGCPTPGETWCDSDGCVSVLADELHCGGCGEECGAEQECIDGACACPDPLTPDHCPGVGCTSHSNDPDNCGACGTQCASGGSCVDGECACQGFDDAVCGGECVDLVSDAQHCGACDNACPAEQYCELGACDCIDTSLSPCGDSCYDLVNDEQNCGACGNVCGSGETCFASACTCSSGLYCAGTCMPVGDEQNCGTCGNACGSTQYCGSGGVCACISAGHTACGLECYNLSTDPVNCGSCGSVCDPSEVCSSGACQCPAGETWCAAISLCVDLKADENNCGQCGNVCDPGEICTNSACNCPLNGHVFCPSAGACVNVSTSAQHCGACDNACDPTETCQNGICDCPLSTDQYCPSQGQCVNTVSNDLHCGQCDSACPLDMHCTSSTCVCDVPGFTKCGSACYDLQNDETHCGNCATACTGNYSCITGQCKCPTPPLPPESRITLNGAEDLTPSAAWNGTHVGVAYTQLIASPYHNIRFARIAPDGTVASDVALTNYASHGAISEPRVVWSGTEFGLVWLQRAVVNREAVFMRLDAAGVPIGPPVVVYSGSISAGMTSPSIAWSPVYGGYAVALSNSSVSALVFRRLGADASNPDPANLVPSVYGDLATGMAAAPDGTWGVASGNNANVFLTLFNLDGSQTVPPATLTSTAVTSTYSFHPALVHDGTTWVTAWVASGSPVAVAVNRGASVNTPAKVVLGPASGQIGDVRLGIDGNALTIAWTQRPGSSGNYDFWMQRFAIPSTLTSLVTPIHDKLKIVATATTFDLGNVDITQAGPLAMALWSDTRWGQKEIYAAPIDLLDCP